MKLLTIFSVVTCLSASGMAQLIAQNITESFQYPASGGVFYNAEKLPGPINGLIFENLVPTVVIYNIDGPYSYEYWGGIVPPKYAEGDGWYAAPQNGSAPAVISSRYNGSCVATWELHALSYGCTVNSWIYNENGTIVGEDFGPANCSVRIEGFDKDGACVGHERFYYDAAQAVRVGLLAYPMATNFTGDGGLRGKRIKKLKVKVVNESPPEFFNFRSGIDDVTYTLYNRTACAQK